MKNLICKGISYAPTVASIFMVIALGFEIADRIKSWKKLKQTATVTPGDNPEGGDEVK